MDPSPSASSLPPTLCIALIRMSSKYFSGRFPCFLPGWTNSCVTATCREQIKGAVIDIKCEDTQWHLCWITESFRVSRNVLWCWYLSAVSIYTLVTVWPLALNICLPKFVRNVHCFKRKKRCDSSSDFQQTTLRPTKPRGQISKNVLSLSIWQISDLVKKSVYESVRAQAEFSSLGSHKTR